MSRKEAIIRHRHIINKLKRKPASFSEIASYLERQSELEDYNFTISKRTFKRDTEEIFSFYSIEIKYDFTQKVYYIEEEGDPVKSDRLMEAFDTLYVLNMTEDLSNFIHFERIKPKGTDNLYGLVHSIKNKLQIRFDYEKYWEETITNRVVEPYCLKEFKNRWYLIAKEVKNDHPKTFALDRMSGLEITNVKFAVHASFDMNKLFKYAYGIITPQDQKIEDVVLSFDPEQGKYIKSLPLHESQEILVDNERELKIKLKLYLTYDFEMELLSYAEQVKVLEPVSLAEKLSIAHKKAFEHYRSL